MIWKTHDVISSSSGYSVMSKFPQEDWRSMYARVLVLNESPAQALKVWIKRNW